MAGVNLSMPPKGDAETLRRYLITLINELTYILNNIDEANISQDYTANLIEQITEQKG